MSLKRRSSRGERGYTESPQGTTKRRLSVADSKQRLVDPSGLGKLSNQLLTNQLNNQLNNQITSPLSPLAGSSPTLAAVKRQSDVGVIVDDQQQQPQQNMDVDSESETEVLPNGLSSAVTAAAQRFMNGMESHEWQRTIEKVVKSVVSVQFADVVPFDTEGAVTSEATGFVVDAERGIVMTNRHVVNAGPFCGYVVFDNHEECDVKPIYRDPVHDFGFLQFDPKKVKHMQVQQLNLRPDLAKVGCEIRVIGNDAGEKLSILAGFISRLDRNAPEYGYLTYNDFNTEYIQAAASASGGSSGSPVVNIDGDVVALQAGGSTEASTDYFLPLFRGLRALKCIQNREPVTRGTLQIQWMLKPFDECRRLGLTEEAELKAREQFPDTIGLLVAETVLPEGPSDGKIFEGDILISINGENIAKFITVDEILDFHVGETIDIVVQRGGEVIESQISVGDLHAITPDRYVEVAGAIFHDMSYQMARCYAIAVKGVLICSPSGSFRMDSSESRGWILDKVDDKPTPDLKTFIEVMRNIPDGQRVSIETRHMKDLHSINHDITYIDRHWNSSFRLAVRNDETGIWDYTDLGKPPSPAPIKTQVAKFANFKIEESPECSYLYRAFVLVAASIPVRIDGFSRNVKSSYGLVVDAAMGLVLVSRNTVPHDLGDIHITIADSVVVPGKVVFLHPLQGYAIVKYDPSLVSAPIESAKLSKVPLRQGSRVTFLGFNNNWRALATKTKVTDVSPGTIPANFVMPRYRAINLDAIAVEAPIAIQCGSGVLADDDGVVRALWLSCLGEHSADGRDTEYRLGIDMSVMYNVISRIREGTVPKPRFLDIEIGPIQVLPARIRGVSEKWIQKIYEANADLHQLFCISRIAASLVENTDPLKSLQEGDIILAVNGKVLTRVSELDVMFDKTELELTVVRNKQELVLTVPTVSSEDLETDRVVVWCGALLHKPHHAVRQQIKKLHSGVYVSGRAPGSPAAQYAIHTTNFITHVNGIETPDLDKFLEVVTKVPDNTYVKLRIVTFDNAPFACSIKTNYHYFGTSEICKDHETGVWKKYTYENGERIEV